MFLIALETNQTSAPQTIDRLEGLILRSGETAAYSRLHNAIILTVFDAEKTSDDMIGEGWEPSEFRVLP